MKTLIRRLIPRPVRNWLRAPRRSLRRLRDEARHALGRNEELELAAGWMVRCHPAAARVYRTAQRDDPRQAAELDTFIARCRPAMVLYDLGAHFGVFSLAALHFGGSDARAVAVDPSATSRRIMAVQAQLNDVGDRLQIVQAAVGAHAGRQSMVSAGVLANGYLVGAESDYPPGDMTTVEVVTVDDLVQRTGLVPTHIKIDVEGFELDALLGARKTIQKHTPVLFIELHNEIVRRRGGDPGATLACLDDLGYGTVLENARPAGRADLLKRSLTRIVAERGK